MKQPKRLTRNQKEDLRKRGMDPKDYMYHSETEQNLILWKKSERVLVGIAKKERGHRYCSKKRKKKQISV